MAIYVQYEGIEGDATHKGHEKWLDIHSLGFSGGRHISTPTGSAGNREASQAGMSGITITRLLDAATPQIFTEAMTGKTGKKVVIELVTTGDPGETYATYTLTNTLISNYSVATEGDRPVERITLNFTRFEQGIAPFGASNNQAKTIRGSFDIATGKAG
jgi:type VI secretion system secreted protein Hcp